MREVLYRGKRKDNGKFVWGLPLYAVVDGERIIKTIQSNKDCCFYEVIPETVGQYIGLTDKNGVKIFEWDIIKSKFGVFLVRYNSDISSFTLRSVVNVNYPCLNVGTTKSLEVIGNLSDNPELLPEGEI